VAVNLLTNSVQYNHNGGRVRVITRADSDAAILMVANTGPPIPAEDLPHIFERFYRADKSRARADGRSGLGLAICLAIVQAHGGTIAVSSAPETDTLFTVRLPRLDRPEQAAKVACGRPHGWKGRRNVHI